MNLKITKKKLIAMIVAIVLMAIIVIVVIISFVTRCSSEKYDLVYATWNTGTVAQNNIERQMVKAFEEKTGKKVRIEENINKNIYEESILALATRSKIPDVFMLTNLTFGLENEYLLNINSLVLDDPEWDKIPKPIEEASHFGKGIYAVPFGMFMMGYFVNEDLLEDQNIDSLSIAPSYNDFSSLVDSLNKPSNGIMGLSEETTIFEWYPASVDENLGWFSWDGEKYNLDSLAFRDGIALTKEMFVGKKTFDSLDGSVRQGFGVDNFVDFWNSGRLAMRWGKTYETTDMQANSDFNMKFIGVPGGRIPIVGDYLGISKSCSDPALAYEFSKFMSFSKEGIEKRMELDTDGTQFNSLPMTTDQDVIDLYFEKHSINGMKECFALIDNGIVEGVKIVPAYARSRWQKRTGKSVTINKELIPNANMGQVIDECWRGGLNYADVAADLNRTANEVHAAKLAEFINQYT